MLSAIRTILSINFSAAVLWGRDELLPFEQKFLNAHQDITSRHSSNAADLADEFGLNSQQYKAYALATERERARELKAIHDTYLTERKAYRRREAA